MAILVPRNHNFLLAVYWKYGIGTLAVIPPEDNYKTVSNYLQKYVYQKRKYRLLQKRYRTRNLNFKNKYIDYFMENELENSSKRTD